MVLSFALYVVKPLAVVVAAGCWGRPFFFRHAVLVVKEDQADEDSTNDEPSEGGSADFHRELLIVDPRHALSGSDVQVGASAEGKKQTGVFVVDICAHDYDGTNDHTQARDE